jgi:hypothetical protein
MTDSLAQSLVDAAAEAIDEAVRSKWHGDNLDFLSSPDDWTNEARAAALAVLEKLSQQVHEFAYLNGGDYQDLADAIRESPCP